jgi:hypothetical protein
MGYGLKLSRRALRACSGNLEGAVAYAVQKSQEREEKLKRERKEAADKLEARQYGKTKNGKYVDMNALQQLKTMGFDEDMIVEGLKQTNNNAVCTSLSFCSVWIVYSCCPCFCFAPF